MDISGLNSLVNAAVPPGRSADEDTIGQLIFRYLLERVAGNGGLLVDLGNKDSAFAKIAGDDGYAVTAVDAHTRSKPQHEEQRSIRFVQSDVRKFDVTGFDIIVFLGLLHHFDLDDQMLILKRCARENVPVILETGVHIDGPAAASETGGAVPEPVMRGSYEGAVDIERDATTAWIGNKELFRPSEKSLLGMFADAGFRKVAIVDPLVKSKRGARRFFLLNCENTGQLQADAVKSQRNQITSLVNRAHFDEARELFGPIALIPTADADWLFEIAVARMRLHFGEREKAVAAVIKLRDRALAFSLYAASALLMCAQFFVAAGDKSEAEKTRSFAIDRLGNATAVRMMVGRLIATGMRDNARALLAGVEESFADNFDMLDVVAQSYEQLGDFGAAERAWRAALEREPQNVATFEKLGHILSSQDKREEAAVVFERALSLAPESPKVRERLISIYLKLKQFEGVERHARIVLGVSPDDPQIHYHLAGALRNTKRRQEALGHARRAAELDPTNERYRQFADELAKPVAKNAGKLPSSESDAR